MVSTVVILVVLNALGCLVIYLVLSGRIRRSASPDAQIKGLREEVDRLVIALNQTTERNIALMEDKIAELSELLLKADKKIGLIRTESGKHDAGAKVYSRILQSKNFKPAPEPEAPDAAAIPAAEERQERPGGALRDLRAEVLSLHREGLPATLISSRVGAPLGEVELVISLEKRKTSR
jgi:hypothetical protein